MQGLKEKSSNWLTLILIAAFLSGCATSESAWVKPIYPSKGDKLTRGTKQQILIHNESWEKESNR